MRDYTKIKAWQLADDLTVSVNECTQSFPREEVYGLTSQLRRASYSVPANIVEGASRESKRDYLHFLYSLAAPCLKHSILSTFARRLKYLSREDADTLHEQTRLAFGCLHGLIGSVEKEAGKVSKVIATATSLLAIAFVRWSGSQWSVGS